MKADAAPWIASAGLAGIEDAIARRRLLWTLAIVGVALVARIAVAVLFTDVNPATANIWEYGTIAQISLDHGGITNFTHRADGSLAYYPTAFITPLQIFLWMGLFKLMGVGKLALGVMTAIEVVTGTAVAWYVMRIARALFNAETVSVLAGAIMALNPVFVFSVATYHTVGIYLLLFLLAVDLALSRRKATLASSAWLGLATGIAVLARTEYLFLLAGMHLAILLSRRQWKMALMIAAVAALVIAPWTARNYFAFHKFIPVADTTGFNLFKGFNPEANGSGKWVDDHDVMGRLMGPKIDALPRDANFEIARDKLLGDAAFSFIKEHPVASFVELPVKKLLLFWFFDIHEPLTLGALYQLQFWSIFLLSVTGLVVSTRHGFFADIDHRAVLGIFVFQTIVMMGYAVHSRYRMNVEPFLFCYSAFGAIAILSWLRTAMRDGVAPRGLQP